MAAHRLDATKASDERTVEEILRSSSLIADDEGGAQVGAPAGADAWPGSGRLSASKPATLAALPVAGAMSSERGSLSDPPQRLRESASAQVRPNGSQLLENPAGERYGAAPLGEQHDTDGAEYGDLKRVCAPPGLQVVEQGHRPGCSRAHARTDDSPVPSSHTATSGGTGDGALALMWARRDEPSIIPDVGLTRREGTHGSRREAHHNDRGAGAV